MLIRTASLTALLAPALSAQVQVAQIDGTQSDESLGAAIASAGDLDGDGLHELAIGAPGRESASTQTAGEVRLFSGAGGSLLGTAVGDLAGTRFGAALAASRDLSNDGVPDLVVGAPGADRVVALDGAALAQGVQLELWSHTSEFASDFGTSVVYVGDCNGDGVPDVAAGEPRAGGAVPGFGPGRLAILSGADGSTLRTVDAPGDGTSSFGWSLATLGDINGDGFDDLAVGAPFEDGDVTGTGGVHVVSCGTGGVIASLAGTITGSEFGHDVARGPDLDGDGGATVFVSAPASQAVPPVAGRVLWMQPETGAVLGYVDADVPGTRFGWSIDNASDDFLAIGEPASMRAGAATGAVFLLDLRTGLRTELFGSQADADFGATVEWIPDGRTGAAGGLAIGSPNYDVVLGGDEGRVELFTFRL